MATPAGSGMDPIDNIHSYTENMVLSVSRLLIGYICIQLTTMLKTMHTHSLTLEL